MCEGEAADAQGKCVSGADREEECLLPPALNRVRARFCVCMCLYVSEEGLRMHVFTCVVVVAAAAV